MVAACASLSCHEELPPANNPTELFTSSFDVRSLYISDVRPTQSYLDIFIVYKNLYDETLEDEVRMRGSLRIEWLASPEERGNIDAVRSDSLTISNLFFARGYNFLKNVLTIQSQDSIILRYRWNFNTDDSTHLVSQVRYSADRNCYVSTNQFNDLGYRYVSSRQRFRISAAFTIFQKSGTVYTSPLEFYTCWVKPHYGERTQCNLVNPYNPCTIIAP